MIIVREIEKLVPEDSVVILGKFDGFHRGHSLLLEIAAGLKNNRMRVVLFTFDIYPQRLIRNSSKAQNLEDLSIKTLDACSEREYLWAERLDGIVDCVVNFPFNKETMNMEPEFFVHEILVRKLGVRYIIAGDDFRFGKARAGDIALLKSLGQKYGFEVKVTEKVRIMLPGCDEPQEISSTLIKKELVSGRLENANEMLGRPYSITGTVMHGKHLGSTLGFPTANIDVPDDKILPPAGVYLTRIQTQDQRAFYGVSNLGVRPSINDGNKISIETNIFDFDEDIYGCRIRVELLKFLRPEIKFPDLDQLKKQINKDKTAALSLISDGAENKIGG